MQMQLYTLEEARRIVMKCAKKYQTNLLGRKFIFIYRDRGDNQVKAFEAIISMAAKIITDNNILP